jgi:hypothetical protein
MAACGSLDFTCQEEGEKRKERKYKKKEKKDTFSGTA